ncbi:unnamed protein product [Closterium sp. NIES-65]|nr:unnamed protein product [Closterium sp. NIES-65]
MSNLPDNFGNLLALKALVLNRLPLLCLPASFTRLASLESLILFGCKEVEELPAEDMGGLTNLHTFHLKESRQVQLPSSFTQLELLTRLELDRNVRSVNRLVESDSPALQELRQLNITRCRELTELPAAITTLHHLTSLHIYAPRLSSLPNAIGAFSRLRKLDLSRCLSLTHLPTSLTQLSCLHELNVSVTRIHFLPPGFAQLSRHKKLDISGCTKQKLTCKGTEIP